MRPYLIFLLLPLFTCNQLPKTAVSVPRFVPSSAPPVKPKPATPYEFGYLEVPENRDRPTGRTVKLPVYIFKSRSANPAPDPVLYLVGGPGSSSLNAAPYMQYYRYLEDRDLILFEQRGTRYAQPHLECPEWAEVGPQLAREKSPSQTADSAYVVAARACRDRLRKEKIDLDAYRTREIAADVEDLRRVLDLDQLNLLTLSYGTKIAQVLMRDYPKGIRSVVMDGPLPLAANWDETSVTNLRNTYEAIFRDCAVDPVCAKKHPSLRERFYAFLEGVTKDPLLLTIPLPDGKDSTSYTVAGKEVFALLGNVGSAEIPWVPAQLENLLAGDLTMLEEVGASRLQVGTGAGLGMRLSVWCAEELIFADSARVARERTRYPEITGAEPTVFRYEVCRAWNVRPELIRENQPVTSDIPTLLLSGGYDPITPPAWAEEMRTTLPNARHLVFPGWTHGVTTYWDNPCGMDVARAFFNDPSGPLSTNCLDQLSPVIFE